MPKQTEEENFELEVAEYLADGILRDKERRGQRSSPTRTVRPSRSTPYSLRPAATYFRVSRGQTITELELRVPSERTLEKQVRAYLAEPFLLDSSKASGRKARASPAARSRSPCVRRRKSVNLKGTARLKKSASSIGTGQSRSKCLRPKKSASPKGVTRSRSKCLSLKKSARPKGVARSRSKCLRPKKSASPKGVARSRSKCLSLKKSASPKGVARFRSKCLRPKKNASPKGVTRSRSKCLRPKKSAIPKGAERSRSLRVENFKSSETLSRENSLENINGTLLSAVDSLDLIRHRLSEEQPQNTSVKPADPGSDSIIQNIANYFPISFNFTTATEQSEGEVAPDG